MHPPNAAVQLENSQTRHDSFPLGFSRGALLRLRRPLARFVRRSPLLDRRAAVTSTTETSRVLFYKAKYGTL